MSTGGSPAGGCAQEGDRVKACAGGVALELPSDVLSEPDLSRILSVKTWEECLTEEERDRLRTHLPQHAGIDERANLQELLDSNAVFHFSNPTHTLFAQLRKGLLDPKLAAYRDGLNFLQQAASRHHVRDYHNAFVNRLLQMQEVFASLPADSSVEQRLQGWREAAPRYDVNATGPTAPPAADERGRKRSRGGRSDKWRQLSAVHSDLLLAAVRALLESWPKANSLADVLTQLNGQMGTLGLAAMEPATVLECLGVVMGFLEKADAGAPEGERTPLVAREKAADGVSAWRWKSECSDARWERARASFGTYWEMQLDLVDGGGEDEAAGGPATGVSGASPGISKARTGGSRPLGATGHNLVPITPAMKQLFLEEEFQRYAKPTEYFTYTSNDGRRVLMAPLKQVPTTGRPREHYLLRPSRPPHVTVVSLVRDAVARLPNFMGTRQDVCVLLRDSQYVIPDATDHQLNQVVSGGLERLQYEKDSCVKYDGSQKQWVYLHGFRSEQDFVTAEATAPPSRGVTRAGSPKQKKGTCK